MARKTTVLVSSTLKTIATMTVFVSILWTAIGVLNALKEPVDLEIDPALLEPVSATIDMGTLNALKERRQMAAEEGTKEVIKQALEILVIEPAPTTSTAAAEQETEEVSEPSL